MAAATDPRARGLQGAALEYWGGEGVSACAGVVEAFYADVESLGLAGVGECWAILQRGYVDMMRDTETRWLRRWWARLECAGWAHEIGHGLGLEHADGDRYPVMAPMITRGPVVCGQRAACDVPAQACAIFSGLTDEHGRKSRAASLTRRGAGRGRPSIG